MSLKKYSIEEMQYEIDQRLENPPKPLESFDFFDLKSVVIEYIEGLADDAPFDTQYIVECAVETIYGKGIYDYINYME